MTASVYSVSKGSFIACDAHNPPRMTGDIIWLDLLNPTSDEEAEYETQLGLDLPLREEMLSIEPSSRLYRDNDALYMTATILSRADDEVPEAQAMAFILRGNLLITIRYFEPRVMSIFSGHLLRHPQDYPDARSLFCGLMETIIERAAEVMENVNMEADAISRAIFSETPKGRRKSARRAGQSEDAYAQILKDIAFCQNTMAKIRDSLVSLGRVVRFPPLHEVMRGNHGLEEHLKSIDRDITSLGDQASFLSSSLSFLLNASLGLINIQQNGIIKFFSVVAVIFLPPTLIASIYGMNFDFMPELKWHLGYPIALCLMFASAVGPYMWFKFKRWL